MPGMRAPHVVIADHGNQRNGGQLRRREKSIILRFLAFGLNLITRAEDESGIGIGSAGSMQCLSPAPCVPDPAAAGADLRIPHENEPKILWILCGKEERLAIAYTVSQAVHICRFGR